MLECKSMNTPMETKLKLLVDTIDIMVAPGAIKPCVTLTRIEYSRKHEETLKHWT
jgi:hypothetical protein